MDNAFPGNARLQPGPFGTKAGLEPGAPRSAPTGWHSRGYMPHFDSHHVVQHVTFHLADSLPAGVLARLGRNYGPSTETARCRAAQAHRDLD
jgi:hypothetical protein